MANKLSDVLITLATQYTTPQHALSRLMYIMTRWRFKPWKNWQIKWVIRRFGVDMSEVTEPDITTYEHFNSFFTRSLKPEARPVAPGPEAIVCPVDGAVSQLGHIEENRLFQAKGRYFDLVTLLGGSAERAKPFSNGRFATLYLSPRDYHRIHMPCSGTLREMVHIPGRLFSVSPRTTRTIPRLFARNERVVAIFDTDLGPMAMVLVGAIFVASIETVWAGEIPASAHGDIHVWDYSCRHPEHPVIHLEKGAEMGRFNMGSTVILLFPDNIVEWQQSLQPEQHVRMGQLIGTRT
jgi:phosphatidylserine decarboxylase